LLPSNNRFSSFTSLRWKIWMYPILKRRKNLAKLNSDIGMNGQWCGSELIFFGFGSRIFFSCPFRIRILRLIFWHDKFLKSGSHWVHIHIPATCMTKQKVFLWKKLHYFYFIAVSGFEFESELFFGFGQNFRIFSDPQPCVWVSDRRYRYGIFSVIPVYNGRISRMQ
jgi:hypothetical protein